ncbi:hypothetical protein EDB19DRAFT_2043948 [Suillus lakei]|nr:hypothetical protein EDB19DRAFT_2043948 [Suillus lakei]
MVCQELPLGQRGWQAVHVKFGQWEKANGRPERKVTSLETKFKQLVKTMKPMGDGVCLQRLHVHIALINLSMSMQAYSGRVRPYLPPNSAHCLHAPLLALKPPFCIAMLEELQLQISSLVSPLATVQLLTQSQQLRDSNANIENLQGQLFGLRNRLYDAEHECDRTQLRIEMMEMTGSTHHRHIWMPKHENLQQEWYPEGGGSVRWITDEGESTASEVPEAPKPPRLRRVGHLDVPSILIAHTLRTWLMNLPSPFKRKGQEI